MKRKVSNVKAKICKFVHGTKSGKLKEKKFKLKGVREANGTVPSGGARLSFVDVHAGNLRPGLPHQRIEWAAEMTGNKIVSR